MKKQTICKDYCLVRSAFFGLLIVGLSACGGNGGDDDTPAPPATQTFELSVVNLTVAQPFSPIAAIAHLSGYSVLTVGAPATAGLEVLAEEGDNSDLIAEADGSEFVLATATADAPLAPGATETLTLTLEENDLPGLMLSGTTMLVNTNDAITAISGISIEGMEVGDTRSLNTISYDSGTEANTELTGTIPGPADGGEGFNAARDDIADEVRMHSGVLTADDGLADSRLTEVHRWDNPVARFTVTRTE